MAKLMKTPGQILTVDAGQTIEIESCKSELYDMSEDIMTQKPRYAVVTDIFINDKEISIASLWTLGELFHFTVSIWFHAIKAALKKRI
jgi:hypothetical protein